jgi:hypothetical protein
VLEVPDENEHLGDREVGNCKGKAADWRLRVVMWKLEVGGWNEEARDRRLLVVI